jgi:hypothetical protein
MASPAKNLNGVRTNAFDLAGLYLRTAGLPDTPTTRRMLAAWFMAESSRVSGSRTDIIVYNNNPLNIRHTTWPGDRPQHDFSGNPNFASYSTPLKGAQAWKDYMNWGAGRWSSYKGILTALKVQEPAAFVKAITSSPWGTAGGLVGRILPGLPVNGSTNNPIPGAYGSSTPNATTANYDPNAALARLKAAGVSTDPNHVLTEEDLQKIFRFIYWEGDKNANIDFNTNPLYLALKNAYLGKTVNDFIQSGDKPIDTSAGFWQPLYDLVRGAFDPEVWLHAGAMVVGALMIGWGLKTVLSGIDVVGPPRVAVTSGGGGGGESIVERYPVIINPGGGKVEEEFTDVAEPVKPRPRPRVKRPKPIIPTQDPAYAEANQKAMQGR